MECPCYLLVIIFSTLTSVLTILSENTVASNFNVVVANTILPTIYLCILIYSVVIILHTATHFKASKLFEVDAFGLSALVQVLSYALGISGLLLIVDRLQKAIMLFTSNTLNKTLFLQLISLPAGLILSSAIVLCAGMVITLISFFKIRQFLV